MTSTRSAEKRARRQNLAAGGQPTPLRRSPRGITIAKQAAPEESPAVASPEKLALQRKRAAGQTPGGAAPTKKSARGSKKEAPEEVNDVIDGINEDQEVEEDSENEHQAGGELAAANPSPAKKRVGCSRKPRSDEDSEECCFVGNPVPLEEAKKIWPERYKIRASGSSITQGDNDLVPAKRHYRQANVDGVVYNLNDDAYIKAEDGQPDYIGRIIEFFVSTNNKLYFTAQWFFRAEDTVMKEHALCHANAVHDSKRVFLSNEKNDNTLDCIVSKIKIVRVQPNIDLKAKQKSIPPCDLYYDMSYSLAYNTFSNLLPEESSGTSDASTISSESEDVSSSENKSSLSLLDLYSGCGAMSTGLCLGADLSGTSLETRWAVDFNKYACESLKLNHPKTEVRNEKAEDFLRLLVEWEKLCKKYDLIGSKISPVQETAMDESDEEEVNNADEVPGDEFEVGRIVGICYGDPHEIGKVDLKFKVRWKGYGPSEDTWEPIDGLSKCEERIKDFVKKGFQKNILPLPGDADVICGGPPCQGISGFNRFRNRDAPLEDPKNQQMVVYMDIVEFLKPRFVLMENVVDILKFANGFLGRYAMSRLVSLNYQARLGLLAAGCYGLPQFRMRVFLWGALPSETLPQFPLPIHDVVYRGTVPNEFEQNVVAYDAIQKPKLKKALFLEDALSDLPKVTNFESRDEMPYTEPPKTEFQRFIRRSRTEFLQSSSEQSCEKHQLYDHRPLQLNEDDYQRVCQIPKKKGANFRDLPGVVVGPDNTSMLDPDVERVMLPSGKPLVPDYAITFVKGKSSKPFGRLWWDETVPTVVTRAEPHNQVLLHPLQDRVLTIRENARLQGFPDFYKLCGPIKERYIQVGNAVAVPVASALGYGLGLSVLRNGGGEPLLVLPQCFPLRELNRTDELENTR